MGMLRPASGRNCARIRIGHPFNSLRRWKISLGEYDDCERTRCQGVAHNRRSQHEDNPAAQSCVDLEAIELRGMIADGEAIPEDEERTRAVTVVVDAPAA